MLVRRVIFVVIIVLTLSGCKKDFSDAFSESDFEDINNISIQRSEIVITEENSERGVFQYTSFSEEEVILLGEFLLGKSFDNVPSKPNVIVDESYPKYSIWIGHARQPKNVGLYIYPSSNEELIVQKVGTVRGSNVTVYYLITCKTSEFNDFVQSMLTEKNPTGFIRDSELEYIEG